MAVLKDLVVAGNASISGNVDLTGTLTVGGGLV